MLNGGMYICIQRKEVNTFDVNKFMLMRRLAVLNLLHKQVIPVLYLLC